MQPTQPTQTPTLRGYQQKAVDAALEWLAKSSGRGGMIVAPTGSGKSHILAAICQKISPDVLVLILTPSREIVEQDAQIMASYGVRAGVCCAGLGRHDLPNRDQFSVIIATPATLKPENITAGGYTGAVVFVDEAHRLNVVDQDTMFRAHIGRVRKIWPDSNLIGLTATPWRVHQGDIIGSDIWRDTIYRIRTDCLIAEKHLVPIKPYAKELYTEAELKASKVAGDYQMGILGQLLLDKQERDELGEVLDEVLTAMRKHDRHHMLIYCPTVDSAEMVALAMRNRDVGCVVVSGATPPHAREERLGAFKAGKIEAICNCAILTTGFDAPVVDMVVLLIATNSRTKYYQILGRGMRPAPGKEDCLLFDGGGNVLRHGIDPDDGEAKQLVICPHCNCMVPQPSQADEIYLRTANGNLIRCPECGAVYLACPYCDHTWWESPAPVKDGKPFVVCQKCDQQIYPPRPSKGGGGGGELKIHAEIPYRYGEPIKTASGKEFFAVAPISLHKYISVRRTPCILVKNAFPHQNAYIWLSDTPELASMGYICCGARTNNHRRDPVPSREEIWARCENPSRKIYGIAGTKFYGKYPRITHFLVFSRTTGFESVEIATNFIQPETVIPRDEGKRD